MKEENTALSNFTAGNDFFRGGYKLHSDDYLCPELVNDKDIIVKGRVKRSCVIANTEWCESFASGIDHADKGCDSMKRCPAYLKQKRIERME